MGTNFVRHNICSRSVMSATLVKIDIEHFVNHRIEPVDKHRPLVNEWSDFKTGRLRSSAKCKKTRTQIHPPTIKAAGHS